MAVRIRVESSMGGMPVREEDLALAVITIGRDPGCAVVLHDPQKYVSRQHASIESRDGGHFLTVGSKVNPVLVNGEACRVGASMPLQDGDRIAIGQYTLTFQTVAGRGVAAPAPAPAASAPSPAPLGWLDELHAQPPAKPAEDDIFGLGNLLGPGPAAKPPPPDPFQMEQPAREEDDLVGGLGLPSAEPNPAAAAPIDPMAALDRRAPRVAGPSPLDLDLGAQPIDSVTEIRPGRMSSAPGPFDSLAEAMPNPLVDFGDHRGHGAESADHVHDFNLPFHPPPVESPPPAVSPPPPAAPPAARAPAQEPWERTTPNAKAPGYAVAAFLEGLGLSAMQIPAGQEEAFLRVAGEITREAVEGIMGLLIARGEMKRELRAADRTMLAARDNNPLKMMGDVGEALAFLFDARQRPLGSFLPPAKAMQDACEDIKAHEFGLVAGTRAAVEGSIRRFDPAVLEKQMEKDGKVGGGLLANRRAQLWDAYVVRYGMIEQDMADDIDRLFERDFLKAYSEQVQRLRRRS